MKTRSHQTGGWLIATLLQTTVLACLATNPARGATFDLSRDYSTTNNPGGPWSYGAKPTLNGPLSLFGIRGTTPADGGIPIQYWQLVALQEPTIFHNGTTNTATISGGQGTLPPGTTYLFSGTDGLSNGFGAVRFTAPVAGSYSLQASARPLWNTSLQGDTDYHVVRNGVELFGVFLSGQQTASYSNTLVLAAGDRIDFMVGRGADNSGYASGLKIEAVFNVATNPPPLATNCVAAPSSLVSWWRGEGNPTDSINGNNGALRNGATYAAGRTGQGFFFDGINDDVVVADSPSLDLTNEYSIELWFRRDQPWVPNVQFTLFDKRDQVSRANYGATLSVNYGLILYYQDPQAGGFQILSHNPLPSTNAFHHFAGVYRQANSNQVELKIYLDGQAVQTGQFPGNLLNSRTTTPLTIGSAAGASDFFRGVIDEVSIYQKALSAAEVQSIYNAGAAAKCATNTPPSSSNGLVVPNELTTTDAAFGSGTLANTGFRAQQVYGTSEFGSVTGALLITELRFRPDYFYGRAFTTTVANIQFNLSTTTRVPEGLSSTFANNVGGDDTMVFSGPLSIRSTFSGPANGPKVFDIVVPLSHGFVYNPAAGNLLLDIRNFSGSSASLVAGQGVTGDGVSRVTGGVNAGSGTADNGADALLVVFTPTNAPTPPPPPQPPPVGPNVIVPNELANADAAFGSGTFSNPAYRSQQVYGTSEFGSVTGAMLVTELRFRPDYFHGRAFSATISNLQINLSTTTRVPEGLSSTFASNVGTDDRMVFNGSLTVTSQFGGPVSGPKFFDIIIPLTTPFFYNPGTGNLLVDIRNFSGSSASLVAGQGVTGDGASRVTGGVNASSGTTDNGADALQIVYTPTNVPPSPPPVPTGDYVLTRDYSPTNNPGGPWSYGAKPSLNGSFTHFGIRGTTPADGGIPIQYWQLISLQEPTIFHNGTTSTATIGGGQGILPPGTTYLFSGTDGVSNGFGVVRFTAPSSGTYSLQANASPVWNTSIQGDTDYHVLRNGSEVFGVFLSGSQSSSYSNVIALAAGDRLDFVVGRGADGSGTGSGLKLEAILNVLTNLPPPPPTGGLIVPNELATTDAAFGSGTLANTAHRSQQVYGSTEFGSVTGALLITELRFRPDYFYGRAFGATVSNFQVNLSTTLRVPESLSSSFLNNVGIDDTMVFSGPLSVSSAFNGPASGPKNFDIVVPLSRGFVYNPSAGNLLLDIRNFSGSSATLLSGQGVTGDGASRVLGNVNSASGVPDNGADALLIVFTPTNTPPTPPPATNCVPALAGLSSWLPLDGNTTDVVGGGVGALNGSPMFTAAKVAQGLRFDGLDDSVRLPASSARDIGSGTGVTVELWLNPQQLTSPAALLEWSTALGPQPGLHLYTAVNGAGSLFANLIDTNVISHHISSGPGALSTGVFQHVALTYDRASGFARLFVNAAQVAQANFGNLRLDTRPDLWLGVRILNGPAYRFAGVMDEVALYNRALSQAELQAIYLASAAGKCGVTNPPPPPPPTNCIAAALPLLAQLIHDVNALGSDVNTHPLLVSLRAAQASFERGSLASGIGQLHAFQNKARAQIGRTDPALADELIAQAAAVINAANCPAARMVARGINQSIRIEPVMPKAQGGSTLAFLGVPGTRYEVQVSEDLVNWRSSGIAVEIATGVFEYLDFEIPSSSSRFFRVLPSAEQPKTAGLHFLPKGEFVE